MAPGMRRTALYTLLACALAALALLPPREPRDRWKPPVPRMDQQAARQLEMASATLQRLLLRDSLLSVIRSRPVFADDSLGMLFPPRFPAQAENVVRGLLGPSWSATVDGTPHVRMLVALVVDTTPRSPDSLPYRRYVPISTRGTDLLPVATDGHTCISVVALGTNDARRIDSTGAPGGDFISWLRREGIGACAYFGAFGMPGIEVRDWLARRQFDPVRDAGWNVDPLATAAKAMRITRWWNVNLDLVGCAAGDLGRCRATLWKAADADRRGVGSAEFDVPGVVPYIGYRSDSYLADMVAHFGRERFQRFWTSDAPVEQAFEAAMGEPIERYTEQWARARIGIPDVGAPTRAVPALLAVVASLVAVGGAAALTRLRQVA